MMMRWIPLAVLIAGCAQHGLPPVAPQVVTVKPEVGICVSRLDDEDVAALRAIHIHNVRLSLYVDGTGETMIDRAVAEGFDVLVVTYRTAEDHLNDAQRWPTVRWQVGNEPEWWHVGPVEAAAASRNGTISTGIGHGTPQAWIDTFIQQIGTQRVGFSIYGVPVSMAMEETMRQFPNGSWITEMGEVDAADLAKALRMIDGTRFPRVYIYALWSPRDNMTLTPVHRQVIQQFIQGVGDGT